MKKPVINNKSLIFSMILFVTAGLGLFSFSFNNQTIRWVPEKFSEKIFISGSTATEISFVSKKDLSEVSIFIVPELKPFISVKPEHFTSIKSGEENKLELRISIPQNISPRIVEGTIQLKALEPKNRSKVSTTFAKPLPVALEIIEVTSAVDLLSNFLIKEFGTLTPTVEEITEIAEFPAEIVDVFSKGATEAVVIKGGSLVFSGSMIPNTEGKLAMFDLLNLLQEKGIIVEDLNSALTNHDLHKESAESGGALITVGAKATTVFPIHPMIPFTAYDQNDDGLADTFIIFIDKDTHVIHTSNDIEELISRNFIKEDGYLTESTSTAVHELFHAMIFRTSCFIDTIEQEEDFVNRVESLINKKVRGDDISYLLKDTLQLFPQGKNCLDRLGLVFPPTEWSLPETIYASPEGISYRAVASDNSGNLHMVWVKSAMNTEIYYTKRDKAGWSESVVIASLAGAAGAQPDIVVDNLNYIHVVFVGRSGNNTDVFYTMYDGTEWSDPLNISNTPGFIGYQIGMVSDSNNNLHVVWDKDLKVFYAKNINGIWSEPVVISPPASAGYCGSLMPLIVSDSNNNLHVVMITCFPPFTSALFYTKFDGLEWSEPVYLNISSSGNSGGADYALAVDRFNHPHIIASSRIDGKYGMYHIYWDGSNWTSPIDISGTGNYVELARLTTDNLGIMRGIWLEYIELPEPKAQIIYSSYNGTNWSEPEIIPSTTAKCYPIDIVADIFNHTHVIYGYKEKNAEEIRYFSHIWR